MATYAELHTLFNDQTLIFKVEVAVVEAARLIARGADNVAPFDQTAGAHDKRVIWAAAVIEKTEQTARDMYKMILAENKSASVAQIIAATDATIQSNTNNLVDALATALTAA